MSRPKNTVEILGEIVRKNPEASHFLLRTYTHTLGSISDPKGTFDYEWITADAVGGLSERVAKHEREGKHTGLANVVMTDKGIRYLLMLDFSIPVSSEAEQELLGKISDFNESGDASYFMEGYLLQTKNSYHYLGTLLTTEENFRNFLGSSLLFRHGGEACFVVDDRWLGHSLKKGFGTIRIDTKEGNIPFVVGEIV